MIPPLVLLANKIAYKELCERFGWTRPERLILIGEDHVLCPDCECCTMTREICTECEDGWIEGYDDGINGPEDDEPCPTCEGEGGWWLCGFSHRGCHKLEPAEAGPVIEHVVVIKVAVPSMGHPEVQARILKAVVEAFDSRGPVEVSGLDWPKREALLAKLAEERDEYRNAWLELRSKYAS